MQASRRQRTAPRVAERAAKPVPSPAAAEVNSLHDIALTTMLGLLGVLFFVAAPAAALGLAAGQYAVDSLAAAFMALVAFVSPSRRATWIAVVGVGGNLIGASWNLAQPSIASGLVMHAGGEIGIAACCYIIARAIFAPGPVTLHRVLGAVVLYLTAALWFAISYRLAQELIPSAFNGIAADAGDSASFSALLYFSLVTLTSTGYGDVSPLHPVARSIANIESIFGQLYPATLIAVLVTQHLELRRRSGANRASD